MEENVALDTTKQKKFVKSIKGIKKLIKKNESETPEDIIKPKDGKTKKKRPERGLVYLSHIPHGFYEHQMTQYFKQFGVVTNARVIRSKRTGNSKGFAFVEFKEPAVAEIVAETMNNYLMGKRLIKAAYVPPEKQRHKVFRKHWSRFNNPGRDARLKTKKAYNENKDEKGDLIRARKILFNLNKTKKKLSELGINYDFFAPVDVPEVLLNSLEKKEVVVSKNDKKEKEEKKSNVENQKKSVNSDKNVTKYDKKCKNKKANKEEQSKIMQIKETKPDLKKKKEIPVVNKKEQKQKNQKLKDAGVNPPENFIKVQEDSEDSDSSIDFDSDEYEKMLEDDGSDVDSGDDSGDEVDDDDDEAEDDSETIDDSGDEEIVPPPKKIKGKGPIIAIPQPKQNKQKANAPEKNKRKEPLRGPVISKKPKFEKQAHQPLKKQFKKKK